MNNSTSEMPTTQVNASLDETTHLGTVEFARGPNNFLDLDFVQAIVRAFDDLANRGARAFVLCSAGKNFCAGAEPSALQTMEFDAGAPHLYDAAIHMFDVELPIVAAVQGAAVGGGLGWRCPPTSGSRLLRAASQRTAIDWASITVSG